MDRTINRTYMIAILMVLLLSSPVFAQSREGKISMQFDLSQHNATETARLWTPYPVSDEYQTISEYSIDCASCTWRVEADKEVNRSILYAEWEPSAKDKTLNFSFVANRKEIRQEGFADSQEINIAEGLERYLTATSLGPIDGEVKILADQIVEGKRTVLERARAIYDWCCENMYREPATVGCGKGDVCQLLQKPGGKCTDISSVFIALCRAAGIPAREIFGIRMSTGNTDITKWQHCWAEFHLPGYGWVSVDPADVRKKMLKENLDNNSAKTAYYREYFWGGLDPYRVALAQGRDVNLIPRQNGPALNTFGYPYVEIDGVPLNHYDPMTMGYSFQYDAPAISNSGT